MKGFCPGGCPAQPVELYYRLCGSGEPVLFVMGLGMSHSWWGPQLECFGRLHSDRFAAAAFDNAGIGRSGGPARTRIADMALDALAVAEALGWRSFHLVGLSMGGMIAQEVALQQPEALRSLTLVTTHSGGPRVWRPLLGQLHSTLFALTGREGWFDKILFGPRAAGSARELYESTARLAGAGDESGDGAVRYWRECSLRSLLRQRLAITRWAPPADALAALRDLPIPKLTISGTHDALIRPRSSEAIVALIGGRFKLFYEAGHMPNIERADDFNALLGEHILSAAGGGGDGGRCRL